MVRIVQLLLVLTLPLSIAAAPAQVLPTIDELKQQLDTDPSAVFRGVTRLLSLKGDAAKPYDRYELFSLRGEAFLRTKSRPLAAEAFAAAGKETSDETKKSIARATELLIRTSKPNGYMPGSGTTRPTLPMPFVRDADRKVALETLLADLRASAVPKVKAAASATQLIPIIDAALLIGDLRALEIAVTGKGDDTQVVASALAARAHAMIAPALEQMSRRADDIRDWAATEIRQKRAYYTGDELVGHQGLQPPQQRELRSIIETSEKIVLAAAILATASSSPELAGDVETAKHLFARARVILEYNWHTNKHIPNSVGR